MFDQVILATENEKRMILHYLDKIEMAPGLSSFVLDEGERRDLNAILGRILQRIEIGRMHQRQRMAKLSYPWSSNTGQLYSETAACWTAVHAFLQQG